MGVGLCGPGDLNVAFAVGTSPDGSRVFVTGGSSGFHGSANYATVAYNATTGAKQWVARYQGPGHGDDEATALAVSPDGSTVDVTGVSLGVGGIQEYATVAYTAATGARRWVARYRGGNGGDVALAIGVSLAGSGVVVTGYGRGANDFADIVTVSYDAGTGARRWAARYDGAAHMEDAASALAIAPNGLQVYVTGFSEGRSGSGYYVTLAYDAESGGKQWVSLYNGPAKGSDSATNITVSGDGSKVFVTGTSIGSDKSIGYATLAYDPGTGGTMWKRRYDGPPGSQDLAYAIGVSPVGSRMFVAGESNNAYLAIAYSTG